MEKIVKYCALCEEDFTNEFSFCPKCAASLTIKNNDKVFAEKMDFQITTLNQTSSSRQKMLFFAAFFFISGCAVLALVISIYSKEFNIGEFDEYFVSNGHLPPSETILTQEDHLLQGKDKPKKGGGNGGKDDPTPVSLGERANQSENPLFTPTAKNVRLTDPDLRINRETKGEVIRTPKDEKYGAPESPFLIDSDGPGKGRDGQGTGKDRGQGTGKGDGTGPGEGPNIGINPYATGGKPEKSDNQKPPEKLKITSPLKIIFKPKAIYTNEARKNLVAGTVVLRVTFMANGKIEISVSFRLNCRANQTGDCRRQKY